MGEGGGRTMVGIIYRELTLMMPLFLRYCDLGVMGRVGLFLRYYEGYLESWLGALLVWSSRNQNI